MEMTNALLWFEIPVEDFDRAKAFYEAILDFEMPVMPVQDEKLGILPHVQGEGIGGAIYKEKNFQATKNGVKIYLNGGKDLNVALNRVEGAGGKVLVPKTQITPELGYWAMFEDSEGNEICLHSGS